MNKSALSDKTERAPSRKINPRRTFSVKGQLVGKLGPRGYGRLLDQLAKVAVEK